MKKIGIICALDEEINVIKKHLEIKKEIKYYELDFDECEFNNLKCILVKCGMGKVNAARTAQILIDKFDVDYVFNVGVAGGISEDLNVGDIIVGTELVQHDFDARGLTFEKGLVPNSKKYLASDKKLCDLVLNNNDGVKPGIIATGDLFCTDPLIAKEINEEFNAVCVEMEGASIAQVCYLCDIPFIIIRGISDIPNNNNKIDFEEFLKNDVDNIGIIVKRLLEQIK